MCNGYRDPLLLFWCFYGFLRRHCLFCSVKPNEVSFLGHFFFLVVSFSHLVVAENKDLGKSVESCGFGVVIKKGEV